MQIAEVQLLGSALPPNVVQAGDPIIASSSNSPGSEGVANAIDGTQAKYLNFDSANDAKTSGFVVSPSVGNTRSEVCWAIVSADGRYAWVTNFGDGTISRYAVGADGSLALADAVAATTVEGTKGIRDAARSAPQKSRRSPRSSIASRKSPAAIMRAGSLATSRFFSSRSLRSTP